MTTDDFEQYGARCQSHRVQAIWQGNAACDFVWISTTRHRCFYILTPFCCLLPIPGVGGEQPPLDWAKPESHELQAAPPWGSYYTRLFNCRLCYLAVRTLVTALAFSQLGKARQAGALPPAHGYQKQPTAINRFLAGASASPGVAHQFTTGASPFRAAMGDGGSESGLLIDQMKLKVGANE